MFGRGKHGGGWGGGGRGRMFAQGDLRYVILSLLAERPRHGYDIIKALEERSGGAYAPSPGAVYPILTLLEEQGHAVATESAGKRLYAITETGSTALDPHRPQVEGILARLDLIAREGGGHSAPDELVQAVHLLRHALAMRAGRPPWTEREIAAIREILERAASEVSAA